jgi:hypothetical protein
MILPDASAAATALDGAPLSKDEVLAQQQRDGSTPAPDNSKAVTALMFTEGTAFTTIEFDSAPDGPVPPDVVTDIGQKQDDAIKKVLPA